MRGKIQLIELSRCPWCTIELEHAVQLTYRELKVLLIDHYRGLDLGGRYHLDVDAFVGKRLEHLGGNADMRAHPDSHQRYLANAVVADNLACGKALPCLARKHVKRLFVFAPINRERKVSVARCTDVLHDHVDIDIGRRDGTQDRVSDAGTIFDPHE